MVMFFFYGRIPVKFNKYLISFLCNFNGIADRYQINTFILYTCTCIYFAFKERKKKKKACLIFFLQNGFRKIVVEMSFFFKKKKKTTFFYISYHSNYKIIPERKKQTNTAKCRKHFTSILHQLNEHFLIYILSKNKCPPHVHVVSHLF